MRGIPPPAVARLLGHADVGMTLRYTHLGDRDIEEAADEGRTGGRGPDGTSMTGRLLERAIPNGRPSRGHDHRLGLRPRRQDSAKRRHALRPRTFRRTIGRGRAASKRTARNLKIAGSSPVSVRPIKLTYVLTDDYSPVALASAKVEPPLRNAAAGQRDHGGPQSSTR